MDSTGAVLPGVTVTAVNEDTGVSRSSTSDATGDYRLPALLPGTYTVRAELSGFQTVETTGVLLTIQQTIILNQELALAQVEETVTVTGTAPLLDTRRSGHLNVGVRSPDPGSPGGLPPLGGPRAADPRHQPGRDPRLLLPRQREHGRRWPLLRERLHRGRGEQHLGRDGRSTAELPDGRHWRVPGHDQQLQGRVRTRHRRSHDGGDEVGHQRLRGKRVLVFPRQGAHGAHPPAEGVPEERPELREAGVPPAPVRRLLRRPDCRRPDALLLRLRADERGTLLRHRHSGGLPRASTGPSRRTSGATCGLLASTTS